MNQEMRDDLAAASAAGIVSVEQAERLGSYLEERRQARAAPAAQAATPAADEPNPLEDSEMPRFVRGFHDILITIGVLILLAGVAGLTHPALAVIPTILLAELLVRRQRLALPAFALTFAYGATVTMAVLWVLDKTVGPMSQDEGRNLLLLLAAYLLVLPPFYWRYRVPVALAGMIALTSCVAVFYIGAIVDSTLYHDGQHHPAAMIIVGLLGALVMLALAVRFDLSDPARVTRRSDVAFWLHLVTAPALLYSILALIFIGRPYDNNWDISAIATTQPVTVVIVVALFVLFGLVMDRRAFVTSSLLSLGFSLAALFRNGFGEIGDVVSVALLALGIIVLGIGVFWTVLRRAALSLLPVSMQARLPPLR